MLKRDGDVTCQSPLIQLERAINCVVCTLRIGWPVKALLT